MEFSWKFGTRRHDISIEYHKEIELRNPVWVTQQALNAQSFYAVII